MKIAWKWGGQLGMEGAGQHVRPDRRSAALVGGQDLHRAEARPGGADEDPPQALVPAPVTSRSASSLQLRRNAFASRRIDEAEVLGVADDHAAQVPRIGRPARRCLQRLLEAGGTICGRSRARPPGRPGRPVPRSRGNRTSRGSRRRAPAGLWRGLRSLPCSARTPTFRSPPTLAVLEQASSAARRRSPSRHRLRGRSKPAAIRDRGRGPLVASTIARARRWSALLKIPEPT